MNLVQSSETDRATMIVAHSPSMESLSGNLHPKGNLFETSVNIHKARNDHRRLLQIFLKNDIKVLEVTEILKELEFNVLLSLAEQSLEYKLPTTATNEEQSSQENYKKQVLESSTHQQLIDIILMRPIVRLEKDGSNTDFIVSDISIRPVSNLCFCRDQQITTDKGVVMCRMQSQVRSYETVILKEIWKHLGANLMEVSHGIIEGGDFIPLGETAFLGIGLRTDIEAAMQLMENNFIGYSRFVLVVDEADLSHQRMHLDTIFNIVSEKVGVLLDTVIDGPHTRTIRVFDKDANGEYQENMHFFQHDFYDYLVNELHFHVIPVSEKQQAEYLINFLNLGVIGGKTVIASVHPELKQLVEDSRIDSDVVVEYVEFSGMTAMYGAAHCSTQVIRENSPKIKVV